MSHDKQDKKLSESRSRIGSMTFEELKRHMGIDVSPGDWEDESGTPNDKKNGN